MTNIKYKDSVFSFIFSNPNTLRELYGALEGITLPPDVPVIINTLSDVLFKDRVNDISFEIAGKLVVLIEHQSTINPNIAMRLLMYIARIYEKMIKDKNLYANRKILIPQPEFFVLYNGISPYPDEQIIKLSDMFESTESLGLPIQQHSALELAVRVININEGKNEQIAQRCRTLAEYRAFIAKAREFEQGGENRGESVKKAVIYCRSHDILKEFLESNATEVMNMLMTEWNWDDAIAVAREEGLEDGREEGAEETKVEIARNAFGLGIPAETVQKMTGLDMEVIAGIQTESIARKPQQKNIAD
jgi:predicted transposase/invertase (TIGR01784 family)